MTPRDFCYWLQGYLEVSNAKELTEDQIKMVKRHLNLVFHSQPVISASYVPLANWATCSISKSNEGCSPVEVDTEILVGSLEQLSRNQEPCLKENDILR